eukprot:Phypoly_transcript_07853.p1 GENE.Phypoly_transcript_07853~~Phypoly_transcript_07853.p1  ORF type:complete len:331 (+),score=32.30 Phypoly_transcript_07853:155-1147(+)
MLRLRHKASRALRRSDLYLFRVANYHSSANQSTTHSKNNTYKDSELSKEQFFADLSEGCPWISFPNKNNLPQLNTDFTNGFTYIPNYLPKDEHDYFYKAALVYAGSGIPNVKHDGRQVLTGLMSGFYQRFFEKLKSDGILKKPEQFPPNLYRNGDGILPHFDNILHIGETVVSISLGVPDVVKFVHIATGKFKEFYVEPRSLYIMSKDVRYNCTHGIDAGKEKIFEGRKISRTGHPRVSLIAAEMFQPPIIDAPGATPGMLGITMKQFKDFCIIGTCGIWQHLDKERGYTNMQQKVEVMKQLGRAHFPDLFPYFSNHLNYLANHAIKHSL